MKALILIVILTITLASAETKKGKKRFCLSFFNFFNKHTEQVCIMQSKDAANQHETINVQPLSLAVIANVQKDVVEFVWQQKTTTEQMACSESEEDE